MRYPAGEEARLGDKVRLGDAEDGLVVCSLDTGEFSEEFSREDWQSLGKGILIRFEQLGLVHYVIPEETLVLLERSRKDG